MGHINYHPRLSDQPCVFEYNNMIIMSYYVQSEAVIHFSQLNIRSFSSLGGSLGAWCSDDTDGDQWFQIDLLTTMNVSAVASQGFGYGGNWVTQYSLNYSCDGVRWFRYTLQGGHEVFKANNDSDSVVTNRLEVPILARFVRINPLAWNQLGSICLRLELYGCQTNQVCPHPTQDTTLVATTKAVPLSNAVTKTTPAPSGKDQSNTSPQSPSQWSSGKHVTDTAVPTTNATPIVCSEALGMQSGAINNSQIRASSYKSSWTRPSEGRLHNQLSLQKRSFGGWCAKDSDNHPFLQVNLKTSTVITALATQGLPLRDNSALRYKLNYSCDGKVWFEYQDGKIFEGYKNNNRARQNKLLVPLKARLVRIRLLSRKHEKACLRLEIYGCKEANADCGNKDSINFTKIDEEYSTQDLTVTKDASLTGTVKRPTRPKDMIVIVNAPDQRRLDNSAEYNKIRRKFIFLTLITLLLNFL